MRGHLRCSIGATAAAIAAQPVAAQTEPPVVTAAPSPAPAEAPAGDIIVTARRREENISKVPIAISALGSQALASRSIRSEADLQSSVPGLTIRTAGSSNILNYAIRGQTIDAYSNSAPSVLPYINEVQIQTFGSSAFFDLQGIQVLKGPQGTLFGRNTTGGAVLYQTVVPGDRQEGYFSLRGGNYREKQIQFAGTMPVTEGVAFRVAGNFSDGGAFVRNDYDGKKYGDNLNKSGRFTLHLRPSDALRNTTAVQYSEDTGTNAPALTQSANACGSVLPNGVPAFSAAACLYSPANQPFFGLFLAAHPGLYSGGLSAFPAFEAAQGKFHANVNSSLRHKAHDFFVTNKTDLNLSPNLVLKNIIGFNRAFKDDIYDYDGSPYPIFENVESGQAQVNRTQQFSDEIQIQGKALGGAMTYTAGFYYSRQKSVLLSVDRFFDISPLGAPTLVTYHFQIIDSSLAGFAQATYNITDALHFTGGFRYSSDKITAKHLAGSVFAGLPGTLPKQSRKDSKPSWVASLDYQVTPALLLYVTTRGSWRTGGFNFSSLPINATAAVGGNIFLPETTHDVEGGAKFNGRLAGVPVTADIALYNQWIRNVQRANFQVINGAPALVTNNVPEAQIRGVEASVTARPSAWLEMGVSGSFTRARFTQRNTLALGVPVTYGPYGDVPKFSGSIYVQVKSDLSDGSSISLRGDAYGQTKFYYSNLADTYTPGTVIPGYALVNARLAWQHIGGGGMSLALYVKNILNKEYFTGGFAAGNSFGANARDIGQPRKFGVEARFDF